MWLSLLLIALCSSCVLPSVSSLVVNVEKGQPCCKARRGRSDRVQMLKTNLEKCKPCLVMSCLVLSFIPPFSLYIAIAFSCLVPSARVKIRPRQDKHKTATLRKKTPFSSFNHVVRISLSLSLHLSFAIVTAQDNKTRQDKTRQDTSILKQSCLVLVSSSRSSSYHST